MLTAVTVGNTSQTLSLYTSTTLPMTLDVSSSGMFG
jgi:hypothetical protein